MAPYLPRLLTDDGGLRWTGFHNNPDIVGEICEHLFSPYDDLDGDSDPDSQQSRQDLAWLARTCKAFMDPALDRLWRSLDTLYPLFRILPAFVRTDGTHVLRGTITPQEWERFDWYARRVKKFCYTRDPDHLDIAMHVYFRVAQLHAGPLLPNLRHLWCPDISQSDFLISGVCLFLSPSLQTLEFFKITPVEDKLTGTFLHTLWNDGSQLETISLRGHGLSPGTLELILNFGSLRSLELTGMGPAFEFEWLKKLGMLPKLDDLALDFTDSRIDTVEVDLEFRHLRSLMITAPLAFTRMLLPRIATSILEMIVAATPVDTVSDRIAFVGYVVGRWGSTLRDFSLVHTNNDPQEEIQLVTISPLLPLKQLTGIRLEGYVMDLTDDNIRHLGSAWPNITKLLLPFTAGSERVRPTIDSLKILAELCPNLQHLRIPLSTAHMPMFVPPPPPQYQHHQMWATPTSPVSLDGAWTDASASDGSTPSSPSSMGTGRLVLGGSRRKLPHPLERLVISTSDDQTQSKEQLNLARHIDHLFPSLQHIGSFEGHDEDRWGHIHDIVQAFQTIRKEALANRLYSTF